MVYIPCKIKAKIGNFMLIYQSQLQFSPTNFYIICLQTRKSTYHGATPSELMEALFSQSACSYRVCTGYVLIFLYIRVFFLQKSDIFGVNYFVLSKTAFVCCNFVPPQRERHIELHVSVCSCQSGKDKNLYLSLLSFTSNMQR